MFTQPSCIILAISLPELLGGHIEVAVISPDGGSGAVGTIDASITDIIRGRLPSRQDVQFLGENLEYAKRNEGSVNSPHPVTDMHRESL
jgi:hypothetical protein